MSIWTRLQDHLHETNKPAPEYRGRPRSKSGLKLARVKWYNPEKGFGFITPDDGGPDLFVHFSVLQDLTRLNEGDRVVYEKAEGRKGPEASRVTAA